MALLIRDPKNSEGWIAYDWDESVDQFIVYGRIISNEEGWIAVSEFAEDEIFRTIGMATAHLEKVTRELYD